MSSSNINSPLPFDENAENVRIYWRYFRRVVKSCGQTAYYFKTMRNLESEVPDVVKLAQSKGYNLCYYKGKTAKWVCEARRDLYKFKAHMKDAYDLDLYCPDRKFLNNLVDEDRRASYYDTIRRFSKELIILTPDEVEGRYQKRLAKREAKLKKGGKT